MHICCSKSFQDCPRIRLPWMCRLKQAKELSFVEDSKKAEAHQAIDFGAWTSEFEKVRELVDEAKPAVAFTHNDLLSGNILVPKEVSLICYQHYHDLFYKVLFASSEISTLVVQTLFSQREETINWLLRACESILNATQVVCLK